MWRCRSWLQGVKYLPGEQGFLTTTKQLENAASVPIVTRNRERARKRPRKRPRERARESQRESQRESERERASYRESQR